MIWKPFVDYVHAELLSNMKMLVPLPTNYTLSET